MCEWIVFDVGVEIGSILKADGIRCGPAAYGGIVITPAEIDPAAFEVKALAGKVPRIPNARVARVLFVVDFFLAKSGVSVGFNCFSCFAINEEGYVSTLVVNRHIGSSI